MSKKHFIALADAIRPTLQATEGARQENPRDQFIAGDLNGLNHMVDILADFCQSQNPHFNRERWLAYIAGECGPNGGRKAVSR